MKRTEETTISVLYINGTSLESINGLSLGRRTAQPGDKDKRPVNIYHFENHRSIAYYYTHTIPMSIGILF